MDELRKVWRGGYELPAAFWLFYALGCVAILFLGSIFASIGFWAGSPKTGIILINAFLIAYLVFVMVGVWLSASHYTGAPGWAIAAKIVLPSRG
jgi:hypothetical protein